MIVLKIPGFQTTLVSRSRDDLGSLVGRCQGTGETVEHGTWKAIFLGCSKFKPSRRIEIEEPSSSFGQGDWIIKK
jgi:hypothetical protein